MKRILVYMGHEYYRVSGACRCARCGKPDWCLWSPTHPGASICQRPPNAGRAVGRDAGWYYPPAQGDEVVATMPLPKAAPTPSPRALAAIYRAAYLTTTASQRQDLADSLGLPHSAVDNLEPALMPELGAWAFPMRDHNGDIVGVRLRDDKAAKWAMNGSRQGLFLPSQTFSTTTVWLPEGPTSTAACHAMGLRAIGRPSANTGFDLVEAYLAKQGIKDIVCLADEDKVDPRTGEAPGLYWAHKLAQRLAGKRGREVRLLLLPMKDARALHNRYGATEARGLAWACYHNTEPISPTA